MAPLPSTKRGFARALQHKLRQWKYAKQMKRSLKSNAQLDLNADKGGQLERNLASGLARTRMLLSKYTTTSCAEQILLLNSRQDQTNQSRFGANDNAASWRKIANDEPEVIDMPYDHIEIMNSGSADVADVLLNEIGQA